VHSKFATIEKFLLTVPEIITLTKLGIKNIAIINLSSIVAENSKIIFLIFTLVRFKGVGVADFDCLRSYF
jgi:hypothetical protein